MIKNYFTLNKILDFKGTIFLFFLFFVFSQVSNAQCSTPIVGCSNTDLSNFGSDSNNNAATIEYDNFVSSFHTTVVRTSDGSFQVWGEDIANDGVADVLAPLTINVANFPALTTATPLKVGLGSVSALNVQGILLATDGLYAWSKEGIVLDATITTGTAFQKITIGGNANGLPTGVTPGDVKMLFATYKTLAITTCSGDVWVISQTASVRGNGGAGNATTWYKVTTSETGNPFLSDVVVCRGNYDGLMALKSDGTVYVWGVNVLLGDNTAIIPSQTRAIQMAQPGEVPKMIGSSGSGTERSYYILATDGNMYTVGENSNRQLGDWTTTDRLGWVQPRYTSASGQVMNNIKWFSVQEHDNLYGSANVINSNKNLYAFGQSNNSLLGTASDPSNPAIPAGLTLTDKILAVETGGHTSMIVKSCQTNFGYVGHRIRGSMGDGTNSSTTEASYNFATAPVQICGAESNPVIQPISTGGGPGSKYCVGDPVLLNPTPAGGTLSVISGPGSLTGNTLAFTSAGTVVVQYSVTTDCGGTSVTTKNFEAALCPIDLEVTKTVDNSNVSVGTNCVFTITTTNKGPYKATGVNVNDVLPAGYTFVSATPSVGTWSAPNWTVGSLTNGQSATLSIVATVNASGPYANTAIISGNDPDTDSANNTATVTPIVETNLLVTKTASSGTHNVGDNVTFTITASNSGPSNATGVKVTDTLPAGYTFVSATPSTGTWLAPEWTIGNLANGANTTLTIVAKVNATGSYANTASITGEQNDPTPGNNSGSATPTVNHVPVANNDDLSASPLNEDGANGTVNVLSNDTDPDGNPIAPVNGAGQFTVDLDPALSGIQTTYSDGKGVWTLNTSTGIVTFNPADNYNGTAIITYTLCDPFGLCDNADITFVVNSVNDNPVAVNDVYTVAEDATVTLNPLALDSDLDGDTLSITSINGTTLTGTAQTIPVTNGTVNISALGVITFTPSANFNSATAISIPYVINDGHGGTATANQLITVTAVNDNPIAVNDVYTVAEDTTVTLNPLALDTDLDGDTLSITSINGTTLTGGSQTIPVTNGTVNISAAGVITFTPSANFNSATAISIPYLISDGKGGTATANQLVTVNAVNDSPTAADDINAPISSTAGATALNALSATDIDGTIANYTVLTLPTHGVLALAGVPVTVNQILTPLEASMLTYEPNGTFTGNDTFTFTATDDLGAVDLSAGTITIPVGNNAPVANDDTNAGIPSTAGATAIHPLTATDTDGTIVSYTILTLPANGTLALSGTPVTVNQVLTPLEVSMLTYDPSGAFSGNETFTFTATDNNGSIDTTPATITIVVEKTIINAVNDPVNPVVGIDKTVTIVNVFDNDTLNNNPLIPSDVDLHVLTPDPTGTITLKPDGTVELIPNAPAGNYTLTYEICEKANPSNCSPATVSVTVVAPTMTITTNSYCDNNTPYVSYTVVADNFTPTGLLTINWIDSANNIVATQSNMPLSGTVLWPGAVVDSNNKPTDWPGWILVNGQWIQGNDSFELTRPAVTMQFTLNPTQSVVVNYPGAVSGCNARPTFGIHAGNEDDVTVADGLNGSLEIINVLDNDTLNGVPVKPSDVVLKGLDWPTGITLNNDGTINIAPGTKGGEHTLTYQICEVANTSNCTTATVKIFVEIPAIAIVKTVVLNDDNGNGFAEAGETLTYNFAITNKGNVALEKIMVSDPLPGIVMNGGPINLAVGEADNSSITGTYTLTQADVDSESISNQATASGTTKSGIIVSDKSDSSDTEGDKPTILELSGCVIKIFNAVSANGDNQNERFYIQGLECYPDNTVQIFNRWGVLVFEREHYNNADIAFRGVSEGRVTIKDSNGLPEGTYYYIIRYKDKQSNLQQEAGYLYLTK